MTQEGITRPAILKILHFAFLYYEVLFYLFHVVLELYREDKCSETQELVADSGLWLNRENAFLSKL